MEYETMSVFDRFRLVDGQVSEAADRSGRKREDIRLIAVTKFVDTDRIKQAIDAGAREVGENRAQELVDKYGFFKENGQRVHFIGQLQLNKIKYLIGRAELIQSADRPEAFTEISRLAEKHGVIQDTLMEINIGDEPQKGGIEVCEAKELLKRISDLPNVRVKGLMCIPPAADGRGAEYYFKRMKELFEDIKVMDVGSVSMEILSMGMSHDYTEAILSGANMVRVGSAIFGARQRQ